MICRCIVWQMSGNDPKQTFMYSKTSVEAESARTTMCTPQKPATGAAPAPTGARDKNLDYCGNLRFRGYTDNIGRI